MTTEIPDMLNRLSKFFENCRCEVFWCGVALRCWPSQGPGRGARMVFWRMAGTSDSYSTLRYVSSGL